MGRCIGPSEQARTGTVPSETTVGQFCFLWVLISEFLGICVVYVVEENI